MKAKYIVGEDESYGEQETGREVDIYTLLQGSDKDVWIVFSPKISKYECGSLAIVQRFSERTKTKFEKTNIDYLNISNKKQLIELKNTLEKLIKLVNDDLTLK